MSRWTSRTPPPRSSDCWAMRRTGSALRRAAGLTSTARTQPARCWSASDAGSTSCTPARRREARMRLLFVISDLALHGAQKQVVELSRELASRGHQVAIYTLNADAPRAREL